MCKPAWSCNYEVEQDRGSINYAFDRVREAAMAERTEFVMLYTNPQSIVWNEDTAQFLDEWTQFDMYVPLSRWGFCHLLCRSERLLCRADPMTVCQVVLPGLCRGGISALRPNRQSLRRLQLFHRAVRRLGVLPGPCGFVRHDGPPRGAADASLVGRRVL